MGIVLGFAAGWGEPHRPHVRRRRQGTWWAWFFIVGAPGAARHRSRGEILDTMLYGASGLLTLLPRGSSPGDVRRPVVINVFIHSGQPRRRAHMPIMSPLADLVGLTRQTPSTRSSSASSSTDPATSAVTMGVLGAAKIPWERWARCSCR